MIIYRSLEEVVYNKNSVLSIGMFDGIHKAHQAILKLLIDRARQNKGRSVVVTFDPHPKEIVGNGNSKLEILSTLKEKLAFFEKFGIDVVFIIPFTYEFSRLSLNEFYSKYIINGIGVSEVIEGFNHQLGRDREGGMNQIVDLGKQNNFSVETLSMMKQSENNISSSEIRKMLHEGKVELANRMLGTEYTFSGEVVRGHGRGKKLGYPTANIKIDNSHKLVPKIGVYAVKIHVEGVWYGGMMSIGYNPTFHEHHDRTTEVNIFSFDKDIYGEIVTVECIERTRDEKKFNSVDELVVEMKNDEVTTKKILEHYIPLS
ncbi:MAG: bifunctional riboflavin kinase/FAD synthetase [Bacteroidota bacterium]|nr:bifunctional riboflavin kinase/FAD synthetase [Bacteroidota bacterium]